MSTPFPSHIGSWFVHDIVTGKVGRAFRAVLATRWIDTWCKMYKRFKTHFQTVAYDDMIAHSTWRDAASILMHKY